MSDVHDARIRQTVARLHDQGLDLDPGLRAEIIALGPSAVDALLDLAARYEPEIDEVPQYGWGPMHAVVLLGEWPSERLVEPLLALFCRTPTLDLMLDRLIVMLPKLGAPLVEPLLALHADGDHFRRGDCATILARLGVRDDRIWELLVSRLGVEEFVNADALGHYGDPRAIPLIAAAFDAVPPNTMELWGLEECADAIRDLGGTLTSAQESRMIAVAVRECAGGPVDLDQILRRLRLTQ